MTTIPYSFARSSTAKRKTFLDTAVRAFHHLLRGLAARRTEVRLRELDDRTLYDIGLSRSEITSVAYGLGHDRSRRTR